MNIPCLYGINCTGQADFPITNYSAEAPEQVPTFYSLVFPESWDRQGCLSLCVSEVSQQEADLCALAQAAACQPPVIFNPGTPDVPGDDDGGTVGPTFTTRFYNTEQTATVTCPDGSDFTMTVPAGIFSSTTQEAADARALAYAQAKAVDGFICIGELDNPGVCVGEDYSQTVGVQTQNPPIVVSLIEGLLPPGFNLDFDISSFTLLGNTTTSGQYDFRVEVEDFIGNTKQKDFSLFVIEITENSLPNGLQGGTYSSTLTASGPVFGTVTWSITDGALPDGLTLNPTTGEITGFPTTEGTFEFTVSIIDERLTQCSKALSIEVDPAVDWSDLTWTLLTLEQLGTGLAAFQSEGESNSWAAQTSATIAGGTNRGRVIAQATLTYAGANHPCRARMTITNNHLDGFSGANNLSLQYFVGGILTDSVTMPLPPPTFSGVLDLDFTAVAGDLKLIFDVFSVGPGGGQSNPLAITCSGLVTSL